MNWRAALRPPPPPLSTAAAFADSRPTSAHRLARAGRTGLALRRQAARHRRLAAAICAGLAATFVLAVARGQHPVGITVVTAAHDLSSGSTLSAADLTTIRLPANAVPAGAITSAAAAIGHPIVGAVRRGEPFTDARLDRGALAAPAPGFVAAPVRLADTQAAALLQPGERVDVLAAITDTQSLPGVGAEATIVAAGVRVVSIPAGGAPQNGAAGAAVTDFTGALVVLATTPTQARALAQAQVSARLSTVVVG